MKIELKELYKNKIIMYKYEDNNLGTVTGYKFSSPVIVQFKATLLESSYERAVALETEVKGEINAVCDRCLEPVHHRLDLKNSSRYDISEFPEGIIDTDDEVKQDILFSIPMKILCREDCRGICGICGSNRNQKDCDCKPVKQPNNGLKITS